MTCGAANDGCTCESKRIAELENEVRRTNEEHAETKRVAMADRERFEAQLAHERKVIEELGGWATDGNIVNIFMTKEDIIAQAEAKAKESE